MKVFSSEYLSLLHWRVEAHSPLPQDLIVARNYPPEHQPFDLQEPHFFGAGVALEEIRAEVARKHDRVSSLLLTGAALSVVFLISLAIGLWLLARRFARRCTEVGLGIGLTAILAERPDALLVEARRRHEAHKLEVRDRARRETQDRRHREDLEQRLNFLLEGLPEGQQRDRAKDYLNSGNRDSEEMQRLLVEIQHQLPEKSPEARLELLLESFKEYCTEEEFSLARAETFGTLATSGYREARNHAVSLHDRFRMRAKKLDQAAGDAMLNVRIGDA